MITNESRTGCSDNNIFRMIGLFILLLLYYTRCISGGAITITITAPPYVVEYERITLKCEAQCNGTCLYTWSGYGTSTTSLSTLEIPKVTREFANQPFNCTVSDGVDTTHQMRKFDVYFASSVTLIWNVTSKLLQCIADIYPQNYTFEVKQLVGSFYIPLNADKITNNSWIKQFSPLTYQNNGSYTCSVRNGLSYKGFTSQSSASVFVEDVPVISNNFMQNWMLTANISKGSEFTFTISLLAQPQITSFSMFRNVQKFDVKSGGNMFTENVTNWANYNLEKGLVPITIGQRTTSVEGYWTNITFKNVLEEYFFSHLSLFVANSKGTASINITLYPQGVPDVPSGFGMVKKTFESVTLRLTSGFYNGANQSFVIEYKNAATNWTVGPNCTSGSEKNVILEVTVYGLAFNTHYMFRAYGLNEFGKSNFTQELLITTDKEPSLALIGIVVGVVLVLVVVAIVVFSVIYLRLRKTGTSRKSQKVPLSLMLHGANESSTNVYKRSSKSELTDKTDNQETLSHNVDNNVYANAAVAPSVPIQGEPIYQNCPKLSIGKNTREHNSILTVAPVNTYLDLENENSDQAEEAYLDMNMTIISPSKSLKLVQTKDARLADVKSAYITTLPHATDGEKNSGEYTYLKLGSKKAKQTFSKKCTLIDSNTNIVSAVQEAELMPYSNVEVKSGSLAQHYQNATRYLKERMNHDQESKQHHLKIEGIVDNSKHSDGSNKNVTSKLRKKSKQDGTASEDLEVGLKMKNPREDSLPSYNAPPPPSSTTQGQGQDNDYINVQFTEGHKK